MCGCVWSMWNCKWRVSLPGKTQALFSSVYYLILLFLDDLYICHVKYMISFPLGSGNGSSHPRTAKTRALKSRQMAAALSSGRGGHGHSPAQTARGAVWSETLARSPVSLRCLTMMLSRPWPHVTILSGSLAERWAKSQNLFSPCDPQAADV